MISEEDIKKKALELGWDDVGITQAAIPEEDLKSYREWLAAHNHGQLKYMENRLREAPDQLLPGAKTAILFVTYYKQEKKPFQEGAGLIASYARGRDYHILHRKRLKKMILWLEEKAGQKGIAKGFSDSSPILEKALAAQAGLGWLGKNTLLIHRKFGTFFLLSGILTTLEIQGKTLPTHLPKCGVCTRCLDACPTQALTAPYILDAAKCLSYHLIESKEPIPEAIRAKNPGYVFGCDICQDVCPHNQRKPLSPHAEFSPEQGMGSYLTYDDLHLLQAAPEKLHGTPLQRKKVHGLLGNLLG
jgi:epoxyqueuosine reductase